MRPFNYIRPASAEEAVAAIAREGAGARFIAGGTTLYDLMKLDVEAPRHLVDISRLAGLDRIETNHETLRIGSLALMSDVAANPLLARDYPVLVESLWKAASQQLRNMATVGGNLLQRTRCPYFRNGGFYPCNKRQPGSGCAAQEGLDRGQAVLGTSASCSAVSPGDWPVALLALDAEIETLSPRGVRLVRIADLHRLPGTTPDVETILARDELITYIRVPRIAAGRASTYHKIRDRESYAFALASAAVALDIGGSGIRSARIALGGVATIPWRAVEAETFLIGRRLDNENSLQAGRIALRGARPGRDNAFKIELGARTVADALMIAAGRSGS